jgi:hypothetical protein
MKSYYAGITKKIELKSKVRSTSSVHLKDPQSFKSATKSNLNPNSTLLSYQLEDPKALTPKQLVDNFSPGIKKPSKPIIHKSDPFNIEYHPALVSAKSDILKKKNEFQKKNLGISVRKSFIKSDSNSIPHAYKSRALKSGNTKSRLNETNQINYNISPMNQFTYQDNKSLEFHDKVKEIFLNFKQAHTKILKNFSKYK